MRLGRNQGGYFGDTITIEDVVRDALAAAHDDGWKLKTLAAAPGIDLHALHRPAATHPGPGAAKRI